MWGREAPGCDFLRATVFIVLPRARKTLPHGKRLPQRSQNSPRILGRTTRPSELICALRQNLTAEIAKFAEEIRGKEYCLGILLCFTAKDYRKDRRVRRASLASLGRRRQDYKFLFVQLLMRSRALFRFSSELATLKRK